MLWFDEIGWYWNVLDNVLLFYFIFYAGYYAGKNNLLKFISKDYGEKSNG